ncbi:MAG TPA: DUF2017 family protein [Actinomycetota bacterium]|nr:DUF2017 family protein [Actinomycetota bacterium]
MTDEEREVLRALPAQLREILDTDDPSLRRLHPPAYQHDPDREAEYRRLIRDDLLRQRLQALEVMEATIDAGTLDQEQMTAWLGAINDLRLVLGTRLDVTEEMYDESLPPEDPRAATFALYQYLGGLEEQVVAALAGHA